MESEQSPTAVTTAVEEPPSTIGEDRSASRRSGRRKSRKRKNQSDTKSTASESNGMQEQVTTLESQLQEKERVVAALTQRLEQAAEQLDRLHRSGADRGLRLGGGFPPELIDEQQTLVEDLQQSVQRWEEMQPVDVLSRLEAQVSEIHDMVSRQGAGGGVMPAANLPQYQTGETHSGPAPDVAGQSEPTSAADEEPVGWEALKAGLLSAEDGGETDNSPSSRAAATPANDAAFAPDQSDSASSEEAVDQEVEEIDDVEPPSSIDFAGATTEDLQQAVEQRDSYVAYLLKKLRVAESRRTFTPNWDELNNAPDELKQRLETLEGRLQDTLRLAEVELSLERARLSREEVRLQQIQQQVKKEMSLLGLSLEDGKPVGDGQHIPDAEDRKGSRWLRFLGMSDDEEDGNE